MVDLSAGLHGSIAPTVYNALSSISRGDLLLFEARAPLWFKTKKAEESKESTPALDMGYAFHSMVLEPGLFDARHVLSKYPEFRTNEAKAWRDATLDNGQTIIKQSDRDNLTGMLMSVRQHPMFAKFMGKSRRELTIIARHSGSGVMRRARADVVPVGNMILDFKSTRDASRAGFGKQVWEEGYHRQAAHYLDCYNDATGEKRAEFLFWAVEKEPPYLNAIYPCPHDLLDYARKLNNATLYKIAECQKTDTWPGYPVDLDEFDLPPWAIKQLLEAERTV